MGQSTLDATVKIGSDDIGGDEVHDIVIEADLDQPDMAAVTLSNQSTQWSNKVKEGDTVEIQAGLTGGKTGTVFKGEVVGIEPVFAAAQPSRVVIRAFNKLHVLARGKKSVAYTKVSDADIVQKICSNASLTASFGDQTPSSPQYDHVYQHNQTDLEFLRLRASRIGFEVFCQDTTLYFRKRTDKESGIKLQIGVSGETLLESFTPRLSTANQVSEVRVRAWDPEQKKEIVGSAKPQNSKLGSKTGSAVADGVHSNVLYIDVDVPVFTAQEANNIAKSILQDRLMSFIVGEASTKGNPDIKPGIILELQVGCTRFDGKYYVTAVRHRYVHEGSDHGFRTHFRVKRDARDA